MRELGEQLAVHEAGLFRQIVPSELQGMAFSKKATKAERAPNVLRMIGHFNRMTRWVCTQIVKQPTAKERARCLRLFISLAKVSRELGNFNGLMEVVAALNSAAVFRLKRTWELLPRASAKEFSELDDLVKPQRSHAALRRAIGEGHREASVPYLGLYLTDLTFIEDGNPDLLLVRDETRAADLGDLGASSHQINYAKCQMVAKVRDPACNLPATRPASQPATLRIPTRNNPVRRPSLQPIRDPPCNPMHTTLQPYVYHPATLCIPQALGEIRHFQRAAYIALPKPHLQAWLKVSEQVRKSVSTLVI